MLHSRQRRPSRRSGPKVTYEDPYSPTSAAYAERHEAHETQLTGLPGLVRVDIGAPAPKQN